MKIFFRYFGLLYSLLILSCGNHLKVNIDEISLRNTRLETNGDFRFQPIIKWHRKQDDPLSIISEWTVNTVWVTTHRGAVYVLDLNTGKRLSKIWTPTFAGITDLIQVPMRNYVIVFGERHHELIAYDYEQDKKIWSMELEGAIRGHVILEDTLIVAAGDGRLRSIRIDTGEIINEIHLKQGIMTSPINMHAFIGIILEDGTLLQIDSRLHIRDRYALNLCSEYLEFVGSNDLSVDYGLNCDGRLLKITHSEDVRIDTIMTLSRPVYATPLKTDNNLIIGFADGTVTLFDLQNREEVWTFVGNSYGLINQSPSIYDQVVIVPYARGLLVGLDLTNGAKLWEYPVKNPPLGIVQGTSEGILVENSDRELEYLVSEP